MFLDGEPEQIKRLNGWLRRWWLEGIGDCGAELPLDQLVTMRDEEIVAHVKATSKADGCATIQSEVVALGGFGSYLSFTRFGEMAGLHRMSHGRANLLIHRDTLAKVAMGELFDERAALTLSEAFRASVAREHPDCGDLPSIDGALFQAPDLLTYERPYDMPTWDACDEINLYRGIQVRRALKPEVRVMKPIRTDLVNWQSQAR
ncbi:hypothetical protein ACQ859_27050 [Roseateles chitinivorans]|uniref:hypothetical protein n=1 Tax=Roseateles chitinivorans TaxID=2917965 RepID=UPI003D66A08A